MEVVRYLTLAGLLFSIGVYGALTRRSFAGALLSLSISAAAIGLAFVTFNRLIQPAETSGYFFGLFLILLSLAYGVFAAQFVRQASEKKNPAPITSSKETPELLPLNKNNTHTNSITTSESLSPSAKMGFSRRNADGFVGIVAFSESFAFQVAVLIIFVIGYLLMRLSAPASLAFLLGIAALSHILHRRKSAEMLKKKETPIKQKIHSIVQTGVSKL